MKEEIYEQIGSLCKAKNLGTSYRNTDKPTPRVQWIETLLQRLGLDYELDEWHRNSGQRCWNIYIHSVVESPIVIMAHHDIVNPASDNANDNSASIINAVATKLQRPEVMVVLTDGEEVGGLGAARYAKLVLSGLLPRPVWVLNFELTGRGGKSWFIGDNIEGPLKRYLVEEHGAELVSVPFNDSVIMRREGIDSCVINPLPKDERGEFELWRLGVCHSLADTVDEVSPVEMKEFVEEVVLPIIDGWKRPTIGRWAKIREWFRSRKFIS